MKTKITATHRTTHQRGLTLAEIIVVIALLSVVAAILFGSLSGILNESKADAASLSIKQLEQSLETYKIRPKNGNKYPKSLEDASKFMKNQKVPMDPWGQPFVYSTSSSCGKAYELISIGADGQRGGDDDISSCDE
jgi:general secretion pathway protein G